MEIVLDTSALQHLLRAPRHSQNARNKKAPNGAGTSIDGLLAARQISLALDKTKALLGEWYVTCGEEYVKVFVTRWESVINEVSPARTIRQPFSKKLTQLGLTGTIDRLIIRIALVTSDRTIVSEDSDFWDPCDSSKKGKQNAAVALLCRRSLAVTVMLLSEAILACR